MRVGRFLIGGNMPEERLKSIFHNMRTRCNNPNSNIYKWYGGRGIKVCDEWKTFKAFEKWAIENGYSDDLTLDRIDNDGDYCPSNCRWVTLKDNCNNRRSNSYVTYNGETRSVAEWSEITGIPYTMLAQRIRSGWPVDRAFTEPRNDTHTPKLITFNGVTKRLYEWANELGIKYKVLDNRIERGWPVERALTEPVISTKPWRYGQHD